MMLASSVCRNRIYLSPSPPSLRLRGQPFVLRRRWHRRRRRKPLDFWTPARRPQTVRRTTSRNVIPLGLPTLVQLAPCGKDSYNIFPKSPDITKDSVATLTLTHPTTLSGFHDIRYEARGRAQFRGRNGRARSRWGGGGRGKFNRCLSRVDSGAINFHGSDSRHEKSTIVDSSGQQLVAPEVAPTMNLSTTGADATALEPTALKVYLLPHVSLLPLTWCDICRVDCNSVEVLEKHRTGKRHRRTLLLLEQLEGRLKMIEGLAANDHMKPEQHSKPVDVPIEGTKGTIETLALNETMHIKPDAGTSLKRKRKRNSEPEQPRVCVLCNASCNSLAMFESHLAGKKHTARITRFQSPNTVYGPTSACIPPKQSTLSDQETQPLYYGLVNCEQPQSCSVLNPHLEQEYEHKEHEPPSEC